MSAQHRANCLETIDCVVLAGGLGTRIQPVLGDLPKLLAPIDGKPFLFYLLHWLRYFGARRVVLALGHGALQIVDYVRATPFPDLQLDPVIEPSPLGTAGALRFARANLKTDPVLVVNGDTFIDADLCALVERHRAPRARATLLCTEVANAERYGRVIIDGNGFIRSFAEKDASHRGGAVVNAGVYLLSAPLLDDIAAGTARSLERDVFENEPAGSLAAFVGGSHFIDIGTPGSLKMAAKAMNAGMPRMSLK